MFSEVMPSGMYSSQRRINLVVYWW